MGFNGEQCVTVPETLRALYAPVARELDDAENLLRRELSNENPFVNRLAQHGFRLGGKRLRPALVLLSAKACGGVRPEHLTLATMVEVIHTATLVHDDVLDEATIRRHLDTVNARWNNEVSILLGDYLLAHALCLASSLDDIFACRAISESARQMCEGELRQVESRGNFDLDEAGYLEIIAGKTAALTSCCCRLGAHYAGASEAVCDALARYGHDLGVAFQIADDVLDMVGEEATVGKSLGSDLLKQKATLPLIRLLNTAAPAERASLVASLSQTDQSRRDILQPWFHRHDAIAYSQQRARWFTERASRELSILSDSAASRSLSGLADFVVNRRQ
jgi:octaprenyl-diphosphate synthase